VISGRHPDRAPSAPFPYTAESNIREL
jgi:hypothetical protein